MIMARETWVRKSRNGFAGPVIEGLSDFKVGITIGITITEGAQWTTKYKIEQTDAGQPIVMPVQHNLTPKTALF